MNIIPAPLTAIRRDYRRVRTRIHQTSPSQRTARQVLQDLNRLTTLRTRLLRCRHIISPLARRVRAQLLRSAFTLWRSFVKRLVQTLVHLDVVAQHIQHLLNDVPTFDPHNWTTRLAIFDAQTLQQIFPEIQTLVPPSVTIMSQDPYWRALKGHLSLAPL